jgi:hypothetical protein
MTAGRIPSCCECKWFIPDESTGLFTGPWCRAIFKILDSNNQRVLARVRPDTISCRLFETISVKTKRGQK